MSEQKTKLTRAVALHYDGVEAPRVVAKGEGALAEQIRDLARRHDVPLYEDPELIRLLAQLQLGDEIPRDLYVAVAQVIAFAYFLTGRTPGDYKRPPHDGLPLLPKPK